MCHSFIRHIWFANWTVNWHIKANCVSDSTNLFDTFLHDAPQIRIAHHVDLALAVHKLRGRRIRLSKFEITLLFIFQKWWFFKNLTCTDSQMYVITLLTFRHSLVELTIVTIRFMHDRQYAIYLNFIIRRLFFPTTMCASIYSATDALLYQSIPEKSQVCKA